MWLSEEQIRILYFARQTPRSEIYVMRITGVRFRDNWKIYDFDATEVPVSVGNRVIVDSERGVGFARVVRLREAQEPPAPAQEPQEVPLEEEVGKEEPGEGPLPSFPQALKSIRKVLRIASEDDISRDEKNKKREAEAFTVAQEMIAERELEMKLIRVEYSFDASRATFYFFSETRVDFRELVKDLAYKLKSRIEMRQIGVRDVARVIGGFGPCGRELCCSAFLKNFEPVSIRMAKKQEMVLNPAKISGVCGRLLCCLSYEYGTYDEIKKDLAELRHTAVREKKEEEELRLQEERKAGEALRIAEEKRRQEEQRKKPEPQREKQRGNEPKGGKRPEKKREGQPERKPQGQPDQSRRRQQQQQPQQKQKPEASQQGQPKPEQQAEKEGQGKGRRRFWRRKKKGRGDGQPQGDNKPQGPST